MMRAYIAVEGPHDIAFVAELLRPSGLKRVQKMSELDPYWGRLVPRTYPYRDDLLARHPVPTFLAGANCSVAVHGVNGITELVRRTEESLALLDGERPAVAAILDADSEQSAVDRFEDLAKQLRKLELAIPDRPGMISQGTPPCGIFVLPDNASAGTLETLLGECASENYAHLSASATSYVESVDLAVPSQIRVSGTTLTCFRGIVAPSRE